MRKHERGMTLLTVALWMVCIMGVSALALDIGVLYTAHTSAQHAADAAALAGAFSFHDPTAAQPSTAQDHAIAVAAQNKVLGNPVVIDAGNVVVDTVAQTVTVTVPLTGAKALPTYFAAAIGITSMGVVAQAKAEAWRTGTASRCMKPIFIPNTILSNLAPSAACAASPKQVIFDKNGNQGYVETAWAQPLMPTAAGNPIPIRPTSPSGTLVSSQFYSLNFDPNAPGGGANEYRCTLGSCLNDCGIGAVKCGDSFPVETGNMTGPTRQGVNDWTGNPGDTYLGPGEYQTANGTVFDTSRSLGIAPVWDNCDPNNQITPGYHGQSVNIVGFLEIFAAGWSGGNGAGASLQAYFIRPIACDTSGVSGPGGPLTGPAGQPVRLIQNP